MVHGTTQLLSLLETFSWHGRVLCEILDNEDHEINRPHHLEATVFSYRAETASYLSKLH